MWKVYGDGEECFAHIDGYVLVITDHRYDTDCGGYWLMCDRMWGCTWTELSASTLDEAKVEALRVVANAALSRSKLLVQFATKCTEFATGKE